MKRGLVLGTVVLVSAALILAGGPYAQRLGTTAAMYAALALSWNLVGGLAGYPSFATAAFFGLGAYASAVLQVSSWPGWLGWVAGVTIPTVFAAALGPVLMRLRGHYFAVATLVIAPVLRELINAAEFTGGGMGLSIPVPAGSDPALQGRLAFLGMFAVAAALVGVTRLVRRGRLGWALRCIEQNEPAAVVLGIDATAAKTAAFVLSAAGAGAVGALYAGWIGYIDPTDVFDDLLSVKPIVMALLGGVGLAAGPVAGALVFLALEEVVWRNLLGLHEGALGLLIVVLIIALPGGLGRLPALHRLGWGAAR